MMELCQNETDLIRAAQGGSAEAFTDLVRRHQYAVRACLAVRLGDPHEAEDLAQEVFVTAFTRLREFDVDRPFGPWLRGIAFNLLRNHARKFRPRAIGGNEELTALLRDSEADRAARLDVIHRLEARIAKIEGTWAWRLYRTLPASLTGRNRAG